MILRRNRSGRYETDLLGGETSSSRNGRKTIREIMSFDIKGVIL
jgi:hypothetical protein